VADHGARHASQHHDRQTGQEIAAALAPARFLDQGLGY